MRPIHIFSYGRIALGVKAASLLIATLAIYYEELIILGNEATKNELMSYILVMPFLVAYLLYRKRKMLRATTPLKTHVPKGQILSYGEFLGVLLCLTAFLIYWYGSYTFYPLEYRMLSFPIFIAGCILVIFNISTLKVLGFPVVFLLFLAPLPPEAVYFLGSTLSASSSIVAYSTLKAIGLPVNLEVQYGTPTIILEKAANSPQLFAIDIACAGVYSLLGFAIFATFVAYISYGPLRKKAAIFLTGFPLLYGLNVIRMIAIVLIGNQYGIEVAMNVFHLFGGAILIFIGTLIVLVMSEKVFKLQLFMGRSNTSTCIYCSQNEPNMQRFCPSCGKLLKSFNLRLSKRDLGKIFAVIICSIALLSLQAPVFTLTEGPAEVTIQTLGSEKTIAQILPEVPNYTAKFVYRDREFEEIARQDASLTYEYMPVESLQKPIWVTLEIAETKSSLHPWEACLITYRIRAPPVIKLSQRDVQLLQNPPVVGRSFAFRDTQSNVVEVVLYWFETAFFDTGSGVHQKHVKISVISLVDSPEEVLDTESRLLPLGRAIVNYWQPIKEWSPISIAVGQVALSISNHGSIVIAVVASLLVAMLTFQVMKKRRNEESNFLAYKKLALAEEKLIMKAVHEASKRGKPTSAAIALSYCELSGKPIELSVLNEKLGKACEAGLARKEMDSSKDDPIVTWKSLIRFPK